MSQYYIEIGKDEKVLLPDKYHKIHNLCAIIYDQIAEIFNPDSEYKDIHRTAFNFDKEEFIDIDSFKGHDFNVFDWLNKNEKKEELETILTKHLTTAIVFDMVGFIFESLLCAKRAKMTVAYALLRKPFTDELLILEQLLNDRTDFINRFFHSGSPDDYDPSNKNIDKQKIISKTVDILNNPLLQANFLFQIRYDKSCNWGINGRSNHALHIVTKDKNYKTESQNFNFIFSNPSDLEIYYNHYYTIIPILLIYAASVIDKLIFSFLDSEEASKRKILKHFRRTLAMAFSLEYTGSDSKMNDSLFGIFKELLKLECPKCNYNAEIEKADCELFLQTELFLCPQCFNNILDDDGIKIIGDLFVKS